MIRPATQDDLRRVVEMSARFYPHTSYWTKSKIPFDHEHVAVFASGLIEHHIVNVAEIDGEVIGMVGVAHMPFLFNPEYSTASEIIWWVEPEQWKSGAGRLLLQSIDEPCKDRGIKHINMICLANSPPHVKELFESEGYEITELSFTKVL